MNAAEAMTTTDMILIAQEMAVARDRYVESAARLRRLEPTPGQFQNAISGQRQMARWCSEVARKAKALRGFTDDELVSEPQPPDAPYCYRFTRVDAGCTNLGHEPTHGLPCPDPRCGR